MCKAPPIFCDAHHLISWIDHGPTALTNLVLLCRRHHIDTHHGHWTITLQNGTATVARPTWAEPGPTRTRYRTPSYPDRGHGVSDNAARNSAHTPAHTTAVNGAATGNNPVAQFDPWADTDPPDPASGKHTHPPDDPTPGDGRGSSVTGTGAAPTTSPFAGDRVAGVLFVPAGGRFRGR
ncbi:hypothetical protein EV644_112108 [Kribbella orskensis]|uniref:HNH endonuclease n=1 Tax=Kribbella orskensis TaxID=2512216 RepID=A0ABY2BHJ6_9ACTN|nr:MULTISPECIES: HNH endonuclease signature motif containing protein [Kribbella]TCN36936.1 hypothetical protein EV642_113108 [Kribbella sp. VKM Ac-2500]TCO18360.1 hypothetical protein EV644_112108 [Kribbella orskensis]